MSDNNITQKKENLIALIANGTDSLDNALRLSLDYAKDFSTNKDHQNQMVALSFKLRQHVIDNKTIAKDEIKSNSEYQQNIADLLSLIQAIDNEFKSNHAPNFIKKSEPIVILDKIEKQYRVHSFTLKNIDAVFNLGEVTGIVGANANGKSTLIKIIVGELIQNKGTIQFPYFYQKENVKINWQELKNKIAYVPQELSEWFGSLQENIEYEAALHGIKGTQNTADVAFILERLGLTEYRDLSWHELSGGYKLRFALAKALVWKPVLLVLDEPLANLDMAAQQIVLNDLKELATSFRYPLSIIITSQHIHEIENIADRLIVLERGNMYYNGKPHLFKSESNENVFEFSCNKSLIDLNEVLKEIPIKSLQQKGQYFILKTDKHFDALSFIRFCAETNLSLTYFRDISHSVKQMFL